MHRDKFQNMTNKMHFLYVFYSENVLLHVSHRHAVHPHEAPFTVYADVGMNHASEMT